MDSRVCSKESATTRRNFLARLGGSLGLLGLASVLDDAGLLAAEPPNQHVPHRSHHPAKARSVIWLFMNGGPSGMETFDPKPELNKRHGEPFPGTIEHLFPNPGPIFGSPFKFAKHGECQADVVDLLPHIAGSVDDIAILKACVTDSKNHGPACYQMCSGMTRLGFPSVGSWVTYGLGSDNRDLPGYVVMYDHRSAPEGGANLWSAGFLPAVHQGVTFHPGSSPILYLDPPNGLTRSTQRAQLELVHQLNAAHLDRHTAEADLVARIESFEMAYRMQMAAPEVVDLSHETDEIRQLYGLDRPPCASFGTQLLLARRLVERGVRFIQIYHGGATRNWDAHQELEADYRDLLFEIDRPIAGLISDLKRRGLLDSTLVVWGGEFGRLPVSQNGNGRDHNPFGFVTWLAGGGVQGGLSLGRTDEFGYQAIEDPVHVHDIHATILHLLGIDHERLTYRHNGRNFRLTDVFGRVIREILA